MSESNALQTNHKLIIGIFLLLIADVLNDIMAILPFQFGFKLLSLILSYCSFFLLAITAIARIRITAFKNNFAKILATGLICYCVITMARLGEFSVQNLVLLIQNTPNLLNWLLPFLIFISADADLLEELGNKAAGWLLMVNLVYGLLLVFGFRSFEISHHFIPLICLVLFFKKNLTWVNIVALCTAVLVYLSIGLVTDTRTAIIKIFLILAIYFTIIISRKIFILRIIARVIPIVVIALIPFFIKVFEKASINADYHFLGETIHSDDTRTFLYEEVYSELNQTKDLLFGRGILGTYFSYYFLKIYKTPNSGDYFIRPNVEVGILSFLLKGGYIYVFLILSFLLFCILSGLVSKDEKALIIAYILLMHFMILFFENIPKFQLYDVFIFLLCSYNLRSPLPVETLSAVEEKSIKKLSYFIRM